METTKKEKVYDLEKRTLQYAKDVRDFIKQLPRTASNIEYAKQLIRSSASVGANYSEANESLGKKDFLFRIRIARKEAKESRYWFELVECSGTLDKGRQALLQESSELMMILSSIMRKYSIS